MPTPHSHLTSSPSQLTDSMNSSILALWGREEDYKLHGERVRHQQSQEGPKPVPKPGELA